MEGVDTFILDCDGVLWRGSEPLPGASEAVAALQRAGKRVLFVTNNASKSRRQYVSKVSGQRGGSLGNTCHISSPQVPAAATPSPQLASFGIQAASEDIVAASFAAAAFTAQAFRSQARGGWHAPAQSGLDRGRATLFVPSLQYGMHDRRKVFLVGDIGVEEELRQHGLDFVGGQSEEPAGMSVSEQARGLVNVPLRMLRAVPGNTHPTHGTSTDALRAGPCRGRRRGRARPHLYVP